MSLFVIFKFPASSVPVRPDVAGNGTQKTDAGNGREDITGDTAGGTSQERRTR
ncbi:unnamed protein product [Staurois parvus]|uniref:Uncharacterized protein n=1 Tax=Staurois parvus TaxID=386267 RepID=A0ABN9DFN2_9NEOB|nr:unnamed protein product [Staurois parvus]